MESWVFPWIQTRACVLWSTHHARGSTRAFLSAYPDVLQMGVEGVGRPVKIKSCQQSNIKKKKSNQTLDYNVNVFYLAFLFLLENFASWKWSFCPDICIDLYRLSQITNKCIFIVTFQPLIWSFNSLCFYEHFAFRILFFCVPKIVLTYKDFVI